jgi:type IV pilus assembly protein PilC
MKFHYKATLADGSRTEATRDADDKIQLFHDLKAEGISLLSAVEAKSGKNLLTGISFGRIKMHEKITFARNLASMLEAGLPISRAFAILQKQTKNKKFKDLLENINEEIRIGKPLYEALKSHPKVFSHLFVSMVAAGEESGKLVESLNVVSTQMDKTYALQRKIRGALMYPSVIVFAMIVIAIFMFMYIVPSLTKTFVELNVELPASTKFVMGISNLLQNHFILLLLGVAAFVVMMVVAVRTVKGRRILDYILLRVPVIGNLIKESASARTTRTLSSLLASGVPVTTALGIVRDVVANSYFKEVLVEAEKNIQLGSPMSAVFTKNEKLYPVFVGEMIAVGEETGELGPMLMKIALYYEEDVEQRTKDMSTIIEPVLMLVVGICVGFFAISMISPMYSIVGNI